MTSPIQFPSIQPAQLAPTPNDFDNLGSLLVSMAQHRQTIAIEQRRLALEQQRVESEGKEAGQRTATSKAEEDQKRAALEDRATDLAAHDIAAKHFLNALTGPGGLTAASLNTARIAAAKEAGPKLADKTFGAIDALNERATKSNTDLANKRTAEATAGAAEATKPLAKKKLKGEIDQTAALTAQARAAIQSEALHTWMQSGRQWGEIRQDYGLPRAETPDTATFVDPTKEGATRALRAKDAPLATQMRMSGTILDILDNNNISMLASTKRSMSAGFLSAAANKALSPQQRQLVQASIGYAQASSFWISGQQSSNPEQLRNYNIVAQESGDDAETKKNKRLLRHVQTGAIEDVVAGKISPVDAAQRTLMEAINIGVKPEIIAAFRAQLKDAQANKSGTDSTANRPGNPGATTATNDINKYFTVPGSLTPKRP